MAPTHPHRRTSRNATPKRDAPSDSQPRLRATNTAKPVRAIERAIAIIDCFSDTRSELTLQEISNATGIHKATAFRIITTLLRAGLIAQSSPGGAYTLGFAPIRYADTLLRSDDIRPLAMPLMNAIRDTVHETIVLSIRHGDDLVDIDKADGTWTVRKSPKLGIRRALHLEPAGIALLSGLSLAEREGYFTRMRATAESGWTPAAEKEFKRQNLRADQTRQATAIDDHSGVTVAAIVRAHGTPAAVLWTAIPVDRRSAELQRKCMDQLYEAAEQISERLSQAE